MNPVLNEFTNLLTDRIWPLFWMIVAFNVVFLIIRWLFKNPIIRAAIMIPLVLAILYFAFGKVAAPVPGISRSKSESATRPLQQADSSNASKTIPSKGGGEVPAFTVE